ncbi:MAG: M23 family metallopeptidase [Propylenella sp.]
MLAIRPWLVGSALCLFTVAATAVIGAAAYMLYHDDLLAASVSRQAEMQYAYEERIAALRSELDRITSRHVVQTEGVEQQLVTLLNRQALIEERQSSLDTLLDKARTSGIEVAAAARLPRARPAAEPESQEPQDAPIGPLGYMPTEPEAEEAILQALLTGAAPGGSNPTLQSTFARVQSSLDGAQVRQEQALHALSASVEEESERLSSALMPIGIAVEDKAAAEDAEPQGGPFLPAAGLHFVERTTMVDRLLDDVRMLRRSAAALPLKPPLAALRISSRYGYRLDPFLKRNAFHAGLDLAAPAGTEVRATAPGFVVEAGWGDGYGIMVEIRHAGGVSTRYGHLSARLVSAGDRVEAGTPIGRVGTTGRSTGPHLHYETRRDGEAVNPAVFFAAGRALGGS